MEGPIPAGKGINAALRLAEAGREVYLTGFVAREQRELFETRLQSRGVRSRLIPVSGQPRYGLKIRETKRSRITEINTGGLELEAHSLEELHLEVEELLPQVCALGIAGSFPSGFGPKDAAKIIYMAASRRIPWYLDSRAKITKEVLGILADGAPKRQKTDQRAEQRTVQKTDQRNLDLRDTEQHLPEGFMKPNLEEARQILGRPFLGGSRMAKALSEYLNKLGLPSILPILSLAERGAASFWQGKSYFMEALLKDGDYDSSRRVGAGDAFCAGALASLMDLFALPQEDREQIFEGKSPSPIASLLLSSGSAYAASWLKHGTLEQADLSISP